MLPLRVIRVNRFVKEQMYGPLYTRDAVKSTQTKNMKQKVFPFASNAVLICTLKSQTNSVFFVNTVFYIINAIFIL
jgi:hypothetical protein